MQVHGSSNSTVAHEPKNQCNHWLILVGLGIIGTILSLMMVPNSAIYLSLGLLTILPGLFIFHQRSALDHLDHKSFGLSLIFLGFVLAWAIAWFVMLCYFRYTNFLFAIYL